VSVLSEVDLVHARSEAFQRRVSDALAVITVALSQAQRPYIAYSGGKDSMVVMHLVHSVDPTVPIYWSDDELEYPEVVEHMTRLQELAGDQMYIGLGWATHAGWFRPWRERPFFRDSLSTAMLVEMDTDDWMAGAGFDLVFTGIRGEESRRRRGWLAEAGPLYSVRSGTGRRCAPLAAWGEHDVWAMIARDRLPYLAVYDRLYEIGIPRDRMRVGPLPLAHREHLEAGWPEVWARLANRYGAHRWA